MVAVARLFRDVLDGRTAAGEARNRLAEMVGAAPLSNGFYQGREGVALVGMETD
jgi:hypothetical protein